MARQLLAGSRAIARGGGRGLPALAAPGRRDRAGDEGRA
ncbi:hypothetical protein C7S16_1499 [Burkholderia thailandensis]|uniref:Uncharacterized protein n=1 Tax=Burkholderia thailandensis TaxID=57975 RepID=A0AAW9CXH6_BURTH|nr:hypothetical protein [Burkholderia thailandensis]MDW9255335.1 hypothetical protein [Burkholderia thailandensis]